MIVYTIGFTQKSAQEFFETLKVNNIQLLVDIRVNPSGQLSGFARQRDLPYFLSRLSDGCEYLHLSELAPTKELLKQYRASKDWNYYIDQFEALMEERVIPDALEKSLFEEKDCCLLCSEATPEYCHRRLVAERLAKHWPDVEVVHL